MTTTEKLAISVPRDVVRKARAAVKRGVAPSLSAYITKVLRETHLQDDLDRLLEEMLERTGGPLSPEEIRTTDELLDRAQEKARRYR